MFSILIPTWNNLPYLKNCIESIQKNSAVQHQIIVIVNEGNDGTVDWLSENGIEYKHHPTNVGICIGLNSVTDQIKTDYVVYINDDMYALEEWDTQLLKHASRQKDQRFMLSGTMIEPRETGNPCVIVKDFGDDLDSFDKDGVEEFHKENMDIKKDWNGSSWPPVLIPTLLWKEVGGMSEEFSPGFYSDPDLSMKLWQKGTRVFKGVGKSRVYHFGSKSTKKVRQNTGRKIFLDKWKMTSNFFYTKYLRMGEVWKGPLPDYKIGLLDKLIHFFKRL